MFSKELENLIQATLEDGVLEDNEKTALIKRAQNEGVDLDELEIYINSLLQRRQRELNKEKRAREEKYEREKKEALGPVCPKCGKQVPPLTLKCECGYEFTTSRRVSSVELLLEKIYEIQGAPMKERDPNSDEYKAEKRGREKQIRQMISFFPVPNTKEDIIEFLSLSASKSMRRGGILGTIKGRLMIAIPVGLISIIIVCIAMMALFASAGGDDGSAAAGLVMGLFYGAGAAYGIFYFCLKKGVDILEDNKTAEVWHDKFDQVLMKGRSMRGDSDFQQQLDYYENMLKKK